MPLHPILSDPRYDTVVTHQDILTAWSTVHAFASVRKNACHFDITGFCDVPKAETPQETAFSDDGCATHGLEKLIYGTGTASADQARDEGRAAASGERGAHSIGQSDGADAGKAGAAKQREPDLAVLGAQVGRHSTFRHIADMGLV
jgi:hypothetical protein